MYPTLVTSVKRERGGGERDGREGGREGREGDEGGEGGRMEGG
jgi:hypothetical protein